MAGLVDKLFPRQVGRYEDLPEQTRALISPEQFLEEYVAGPGGGFVLAPGVASGDKKEPTAVDKASENKPSPPSDGGLVEALKSMLGLKGRGAEDEVPKKEVPKKEAAKSAADGPDPNEILKKIEEMFKRANGAADSTGQLMRADFKRQFESSIPPGLSAAGRALLEARFGNQENWELRDGQWVLPGPSGFRGEVPASGFGVSDLMKNLNRYEVPLFEQSTDNGAPYAPPTGKTFNELYREDPAKIVELGLKMGPQAILELK